jgi:hypothetical protein
MKTWLEYFERNRTQRMDIPWGGTPEVDPAARDALIRSLQRFQVGESGEGSHLRRQAATTGDPSYQACIELFIREEQEHARLMANFLQRLDAPLLSHHWSDACFIFLRHLFRLEHELLVLLVPEIIAKRYFRALHDGCREPTLRAMSAQILHDERGHVAFHIDYLRTILLRKPFWHRLALLSGWKLLFQAACLVVIWDHRSVLRALKVSPPNFWLDCSLLFDEAAAAIFSSGPCHAGETATAAACAVASQMG